MEFRPVRAELSHADGQTDGERLTDMTKLIVAYRNFFESA